MLNFLFCFFIALLSGCQAIRFTDPYEGKTDPNRTSESEGLISTVHSALLNGLGGKNQPQTETAQSPLYAAQCDNRASELLQNRLLKISQQLLSPLAEQGVALQQDENLLVLPLTAQRFFLTDSPRLSNRIYPVLDELIASLSNYPDLLITLGVGHVHNPDSDNAALTSFRIRSLEEYFNRHGIDGNRIFNVNNADGLPVSAEQIAASKARYNSKSQIVLALCIAKKYR